MGACVGLQPLRYAADCTLHSLQAQLLPGSKDGLPPLPEGVAAVMASSSLDAVAAAAAAARLLLIDARGRKPAA